MDENMAFFMDKLKELVPFAKEREQELTSDMISDFFGHMPLTEEQMEKIYDYLESNGIFVDRSNDEPDRRMLDEAEEEIESVGGVDRCSYQYECRPWLIW